MTYFEVMEAYLNIFKTFLGLYLFSKSMRTIRRMRIIRAKNMIFR